VTNFIFPKTANAQGYAFEDLLHRTLPFMGYKIVSPSGWYHFNRKWYQLDGLVEKDRQLWLLEAKFVQGQLTPQSVDLERRLEVMKRTNSYGMLFATISPDITALEEAHINLRVPLQTVDWNQVVSAIPESTSAYQTCTLDPLSFDEHEKKFSTEEHNLYMGTSFQTTQHPSLKNVLVIPDEIELWVRRMPVLSAYRDAIAPVSFEVVNRRLKPISGSKLSLAEAWQIQDELSGFSNRVLSAIEKTLLALNNIEQGDITEIQKALSVSATTGISGIRSSLANLTIWKLVQGEISEKRTIYKLSPLGRGISRNGKIYFAELKKVITDWSPYAYFKKFYEAGNYQLQLGSVIEWYKGQYQPYVPYARCLFNPNKVEGLIHIYRHLERL
jgi:hypothetical protein